MDAALLVRDAMTVNPVVVTPRTSVLAARRVMERYGIRHLPVVDGDVVVGMLSDRDIRITDRELLDSLAGLQSDLLSGRYRTVSTVMSTPVQTVEASTPLFLAARQLAAARVGAFAVVDRGRLVGILSTSDCLRYVSPTRPAAGEAKRPARMRS